MLSKFFEPFAEEDSRYRELSAELPLISEYSAHEIEEAVIEDPCWSSEECKNIVDEITEEIIPAIQKAVMDDREDIAVAIAEFAETSDQQSFPLVYGTAHDFTRAVLKWNEEHPYQQFNLVTVKSKDELTLEKKNPSHARIFLRQLVILSLLLFVHWDAAQKLFRLYDILI